MSGVDETSSTLKPGLNAPGSGEEIPAEDHRRDAGAGIGSSTDWVGVGLPLIFECLLMRSRCVGLPEGHDVYGIFELTAEDAGMQYWGQYLTDLETCGKKPEVRAITAGAVAVIYERAVLPALVVSNRCDWVAKIHLGRVGSYDLLWGCAAGRLCGLRGCDGAYDQGQKYQEHKFRSLGQRSEISCLESR